MRGDRWVRGDRWDVWFYADLGYTYIHIGSYKTTPTPTYRSGVKKITLFTPEGNKCTGTFLKIEGRTCNNTESAERCVCSKPLGGKLFLSLCHGICYRNVYKLPRFVRGNPIYSGPLFRFTPAPFFGLLRPPFRFTPAPFSVYSGPLFDLLWTPFFTIPSKNTP